MRGVGWRWGAVAAGVAVLVALPLVVGALPARSDGIAAAELLERVERSDTVGYSGYAEAVGGLALPLTDEFSAVTDLFGGRTRLRVWWRGQRDWRVDTVDATGESGLHRDRDGVWSWDYERGTAIRTTEPAVRLPRGGDLDPAGLGRRLLSEASAAEVSRLPARRVAGRAVQGLRLDPADPDTTVDRVDAWIDPATGLALRVEVWANRATRPVIETAYLDFSVGMPAAGTTAFEPPAQATVTGELNPDLAAAINVFSTVVPPSELAGLPVRQRVEGLGSVGTYGTGLTVLVALPLPGRISEPLAEQLAKTPGALTRFDPAGGSSLRVTVGPLTVLLIDPPGRRGWLLTGTVTAATLDLAAAELRAEPPAERPR